MSEFTMELAKIDDVRSIVLWEYNGSKKYVVCSHYDATQPVGQQWYWGHYFFNLFEAVDYAREVER